VEIAKAEEPKASLADNKTTVLQDKAQTLQFQSVQQTDDTATAPMNLAEKEVSKDSLKKSESAAAPIASAPELTTATSGNAPAARYGLASSQTPAFRENFRPATAQNFVAAEDTKGKSQQGPPPVLGSFRFERSGSAIRIIDQDGSVYLGSLETVPTGTASPSTRTDVSLSRALRTATAPGARPAQVALSPEFSFHVAGTNLTLQLPVIFNGRWSVPTNVPASMKLTNGVSSGILVGGRVSAEGPFFAPGYRILGSAVIKDGEGITINAISTQP
jgi:hypothetical protein